MNTLKASEELQSERGLPKLLSSNNNLVAGVGGYPDANDSTSVLRQNAPTKLYMNVQKTKTVLEKHQNGGLATGSTSLTS